MIVRLLLLPFFLAFLLSYAVIALVVGGFTWMFTGEPYHVVLSYKG